MWTMIIFRFQGLEAVCNPILNKPKPKPKEEPPKDAKKEEEASTENKDTPAENSTETNTSQNATNAESAENTEDKADMELDWWDIKGVNIPYMYIVHLGMCHFGGWGGG